MQSIDWRRLGEAAGPLLERGPAVLSTVLVVALAYSLAQLSWRLVPAPAEQNPPPSVARLDRAAAATETESESRTVGGQTIARQHLFGEAGKAPPPPKDVPIEAPETQLRLTLQGVYVPQRSGGRAWAIIADASGNDETYVPGSALPGGATLKEIHKDRVILMRNGQYETLRLPQEMLDDSLNRGSVQRGGGVNRTRAGAAAGNRVAVSPQARQTLSNYREKLLSDPQSVMNVVRAEPYRRGGRLQGYRVFPGRDRDLLNQVGLRPGDVVTAVNGIALDSPIKGLEIMRDLSSASEVTLQVERNGVSQSMTVPVR